MKQLFIDGRATTLIFDSDTTNKILAFWLNMRLVEIETNLFNLNEPKSCSAYDADGIVYVSGNEDHVEFQLNEVMVINIVR